jgi:hypothetical protein
MSNPVGCCRLGRTRIHGWSVAVACLKVYDAPPLAAEDGGDGMDPIAWMNQHILGFAQVRPEERQAIKHLSVPINARATSVISCEQ